jgi:hypothetical protein
VLIAYSPREFDPRRCVFVFGGSEILLLAPRLDELLGKPEGSNSIRPCKHSALGHDD